MAVGSVIPVTTDDTRWLALLLALPVAAMVGALTLSGGLGLSGVAVDAAPLWFLLLTVGLGWVVLGNPDRQVVAGLADVGIWLVPGLLVGFSLLGLASMGLLALPIAVAAVVAAGVVTRGRGVSGLAIGVGTVGLIFQPFVPVGLVLVGVGAVAAVAAARRHPDR